MLKPIKLVAILGFIVGGTAQGAVPQLTSTSSPQSVQTIETQSFYDQLKQTIGITYFTFFFGPGIHPDNLTISPNHLGKPENDGISAQNQFSVRYKFSNNLALDFQNRFRVFFNNGANAKDFSAVRWEAPRIGLSGKLIYGDDWSLTGAINTDFPYFMPSPFTGYQAQQRTVIFNPGMFASFKYEPRHSPWSIFSVVSPRYFFYSDRNTAEPQLSKARFLSQNKPEMIIALQPTVSYKLTANLKLTTGTSIDYRKQIISGWNPLNASLLSNGDSKAWRLYAVPVTLGMSYSFSPAVTIFPFVSAFPIAAQRIDASEKGQGKQTSFLEAASVGMWINGTIF